MCMKKFDAEKIFLTNSMRGYQVSHTYCQVPFGIGWNVNGNVLNVNLFAYNLLRKFEFSSWV